MTSQKGDFRTNEMLVLKFGFLRNRILVKVMNTQHFKCLLSVIVHVNIFQGILFSVNEEIPGAFLYLFRDDMTC